MLKAQVNQHKAPNVVDVVCAALNCGKPRSVLIEAPPGFDDFDAFTNVLTRRLNRIRPPLTWYSTPAAAGQAPRSWLEACRMRGKMAATLHLVPDEQPHQRQQSLYLVTSVQHRERLVDQGRKLEYKRIVDSFRKLKSVPLSPSLITVRSVSSELAQYAALGITGASDSEECTVSVTVSH